MVGCLIQTTLSNTAQCFRLFRDLDKAESKSQGVHLLPQKTVALSLSITLRNPNAEPYPTFKFHFNVALTIHGQTFEVVLAKLRLEPTFTVLSHSSRCCFSTNHSWYQAPAVWLIHTVNADDTPTVLVPSLWTLSFLEKKRYNNYHQNPWALSDTQTVPERHASNIRRHKTVSFRTGTTFSHTVNKFLTFMEPEK